MISVRALIVLAIAGCSPAEEPASVNDTGTATTGSDSVVVDTATTDTLLPTDTSTPPTDTTVSEAAAETSTADGWDSYAKGFFTKYCVECHSATSTTRNYTTMADVKRDMVKIRCGVGATKLSGCGSFPPPKQFPIDNATKTNPKPTDAERARLTAWIDAGLPT